MHVVAGFRVLGVVLHERAKRIEAAALGEVGGGAYRPQQALGVIIPVFRLPRDEAVPVDAATPATSTGDGNEPDPVGAMPNLVGRAGLEPATEGL